MIYFQIHDSGGDNIAQNRASALHMKLFVMAGEKRLTMSDADEAGPRQSLMQELIQRSFPRLVEGAGSLVEEYPIRTDDENPGESDPLLLAQRENPAPVVDVVKAGNERRQIDAPQNILKRR